jgi:hypothetical protein
MKFTVVAELAITLSTHRFCVCLACIFQGGGVLVNFQSKTAEELQRYIPQYIKKAHENLRFINLWSDMMLNTPQGIAAALRLRTDYKLTSLSVTVR